jgi:hypothetical protein
MKKDIRMTNNYLIKLFITEMNKLSKKLIMEIHIFDFYNNFQFIFQLFI